VPDTWSEWRGARQTCKTRAVLEQHAPGKKLVGGGCWIPNDPRAQPVCVRKGCTAGGVEAADTLLGFLVTGASTRLPSRRRLGGRSSARMVKNRVFFFYRFTGSPRRTSLPLECHATKLGQVPLSPRGLLPRTEEQCRTGRGQAAALRINLNIDGCGVGTDPIHAPLLASPPRHPPLTQYPLPPRSLVRVGQTSPH
jgi:hypothetical protein